MKPSTLIATLTALACAFALGAWLSGWNPEPKGVPAGQDGAPAEGARQTAPTRTTPPSAAGGAGRAEERAAPASAPGSAPMTGDYKADFLARLPEIAAWSGEDFLRISREERWEEDRVAEFKGRLLSPEHWDKTCRLAREVLAQSPASHQTFELPPEAVGAPFWAMQWREVTIPVPATVYKRLRIYRDARHGKPTFFLHADALSLLVGVHPPSPMDRAVPGLPAAESREATRALYGGPVSFQELTLKGFQNTPEDIACEPGRWKTEIPVAVALTHKGTGGAAQVLRPGDHPGWIWKKPSGQKILWDARLFPMTINEELTIALRVSADAPEANLGAFIGRAPGDAGQAADRPPWLDALFKAISSDASEDWNALDEAVKGSTLESYQKTF